MSSEEQARWPRILECWELTRGQLLGVAYRNMLSGPIVR